MAQAQIKLKEIVPIVPLTEEYVELLLTTEEARVLLQLVGSTAGDCRQVTTVYNELKNLELPQPTHHLVIDEYRMGLWSANHPRRHGGAG